MASSITTDRAPLQPEHIQIPNKPLRWYGEAVIVWPAGYSRNGWEVSVRDYYTGEMIETVTAFTLNLDAESTFTWAEFYMFMDNEGLPATTFAKAKLEDGLPVQAIFPYRIVGIESAAQPGTVLVSSPKEVKDESAEDTSAGPGN